MTSRHHRSGMVYGMTLIAGLVALVLRALDLTDAAGVGITNDTLTTKSEVGLS